MAKPKVFVTRLIPEAGLKGERLPNCVNPEVYQDER
jgi:hypothetical protein